MESDNLKFMIERERPGKDYRFRFQKMISNPFFSHFKESTHNLFSLINSTCDIATSSFTNVTIEDDNALKLSDLKSFYLCLVYWPIFSFHTWYTWRTLGGGGFARFILQINSIRSHVFNVVVRCLVLAPLASFRFALGWIPDPGICNGSCVVDINL